MKPHQFTHVDIHQMLRASEGQPGPNGRDVGHAMARHLLIGREALHDRMYLGKATNDGVPVYSAFLTMTDMIEAIHQVLHSPANHARLVPFMHAATPDGEDLTFNGTPLVNAMLVRVALGGNGPKTRLAPLATLFAKRMRARPRGVHIVSAFAGFETGEFPGNPV